MNYEDRNVDPAMYERIYKESIYPKTTFSGWRPRVEPDRRGFRPSSVTYDKDLLITEVFQEKSESSVASSRDTGYTGVLGEIPLYLQTTLEDSERIREVIGHQVSRCANSECGQELRGKRGSDWFRDNGAYYCQDCIQRKYAKRCAREECSKELHGRQNEDFFKDSEGLLCRACWETKYNEYCANPSCKRQLLGKKGVGWFWYYKNKFCPQCITLK